MIGLDRSSGNWVYDICYGVALEQDITAIETRFIPFNIWGESGQSLSATHIKDLIVDFDRSLRGAWGDCDQWRIHSESDAVQHYAMLGYVAQVKLASGAILRANPDAVMKGVKRFSEGLTSRDLSANDGE